MQPSLSRSYSRLVVQPSICEVSLALIRAVAILLTHWISLSVGMSTVIDIEGGRNEYECDLRSLTSLAFGTTTRSTHDAKGNELTTTVTDASGTVLRSESHTYDINGNRLTTTLITDLSAIASAKVDHSALITSYTVAHSPKPRQLTPTLETQDASPPCCALI